MSNELARIADQIRHAVHGEAWHGPAVLEILEGMDANTAAAHPIAGAHSVWELLLHMTVWTRVVLRRLAGETVQPTPAENFPPVDGGAAGWSAAIEDFQNAQRALLAKLNSMTDDALRLPTPGKPYDFYFMLHGLVQHHLYHAGQMALLKKAAAAK
ncbi:MAG: DinB family protein [Terriglobales bacterium]